MPKDTNKNCKRKLIDAENRKIIFKKVDEIVIELKIISREIMKLNISESKYLSTIIWKKTVRKLIFLFLIEVFVAE